MRSLITQNRTLLMGLSMIAIILFHNGISIIPIITAFFSRFGLWGVDIFLFLSGFGCAYALKKYSSSIFFTRRIIRLLPSCLIIGCFIYLIDFAFLAERSVTYFPIRLFSLHRWYIQAIIICYLICPIAYRILTKYNIAGIISMIVLMIIAEYVAPDHIIFHLKWIFGRIPVFLIGMYISIYDLKISKTFCFISTVCIIIAIFSRISANFYIRNWTYFIALGVPFICICLCYLNKILERLHLLKPIELIGSVSLELYLIHEYTFWVLYKLEKPLWCKYLLFIIIVPVLCYLAKKANNILNNKIGLYQ